MSNFTKEQVSKISTDYNAVRNLPYNERAKAVKSIASELDVTERQVMGVLVSRNEYVAKENPKSAARSTKAEYVSALETVSGKKLASFSKANLKELRDFWDWLVEASAQREAN